MLKCTENKLPSNIGQIATLHGQQIFFLIQCQRLRQVHLIKGDIDTNHLRCR